MLDLRKLTEDFDAISAKLRLKNASEDALVRLKELGSLLKAKRSECESLQAVQNTKSKELAKGANDELKAFLSQNKAKIAQESAVIKQLEDELYALATVVPNTPDEDVPAGKDESENVELKKILTPREFDFEPKEHDALGKELDWIDAVRGVKLSTSRFSVLKGEGALINRALVNFMIDHNRSKGFELINVPFVVNSNTMFSTGQLPKFKDDAYKIEGDELYLIPTSEVPVTSLYNNEILSESELPLKYTCYSACFRKEAGSAGKDTRGIIRQHQFEKVELVSITKPEESELVFEQMVECASSLLTALGLPHRHLLLCTGDLGFSAAKTIDLEVWLPGQNKYREISSVSNCRDFQARRAKMRYKDSNGKNKLVHTLNGSSLAVGRTLVAVMENYQEKDGKVRLPDALRKYM